MSQGDNNFASRSTTFPRRQSRRSCSSASCLDKMEANGSEATARIPRVATPPSNGVYTPMTSSCSSPASEDYRRATATTPTPADATPGVKVGRKNRLLLTGFARQVVAMIGLSSNRRPPAVVVCDEALGVGGRQLKARCSSCLSPGSSRITKTSSASRRGERSVWCGHVGDPVVAMSKKSLAHVRRLQSVESLGAVRCCERVGAWW